MKAFWATVIIITTIFLFMLPITGAIYDFRTDIREDEFNNVETGSGETTANVTLLKPVYDDDTNTIDILSNTSDDTPAYSSYNTTTRALEVSGLAASTNRTLTVSYDINAFSGQDGFETFFDYLPYFYYVLIAIFPAAAIAAIWLGRA